MVINLSKNNTTNTTINNLNINILLETKCKNAMNLTEFMNNLQLSLDSIFYTKKNGYIEGVNAIFIRILRN